MLSPHVPGEVAEVNVVAALSLASMDQLCQNIQNVKVCVCVCVCVCACVRACVRECVHVCILHN